jgi:hypothetical protein
VAGPQGGAEGGGSEIRDQTAPAARSAAGYDVTDTGLLAGSGNANAIDNVVM